MKKTWTPQERPLTGEEKRDWLEASTNAFQDLARGDSAPTPADLVARVQSRVEEWQAGNRPPQASKVTGTALGLGALWADQLVREFGWEWTVVVDRKRELYAVATKDRALVIYPAYFIKACLEDEEADCTVLLSFNMLREGKITGVSPASYTELMPHVVRIVPAKPHRVGRFGPVVEIPPEEPPLWDKQPRGGVFQDRIQAEFDSRDPETPDEFTFECVQLRGLKEMRVHARVERSGPHERTLQLYPRRMEELSEGAKINVHIIDPNVIRLIDPESGVLDPDSTTIENDVLIVIPEWGLRIHRYPKRGFLLPDKRKVDATVLALQNVPPGYEHEAFAAREPGERSIVHIYRGQHASVVIAYILGCNKFETCEFFLQFARQTLIN